jgi:hypothetical protein
MLKTKKKEYNIDIYEIGKENLARFTLGIKGKKSLIVIGLNPSDATKEKSDLTISKVATFAESAKFDGFIMLNLYPIRATNPKDVTSIDASLHQQNLKIIKEILSAENDANVLAAWGYNIKKQNIFIECFNDILKSTKGIKIKWLKIGDPNSKHPRHPSRAKYDFGLISFDIKGYATQLNN